MRPATKIKVLWTIASFCGVAALVLAVLAFVLIKGGAYPPEGTGSLGHVGMVIAGIIATLLGIFCGGLIFVCASHVRAMGNAINIEGRRSVRFPSGPTDSQLARARCVHDD